MGYAIIKVLGIYNPHEIPAEGKKPCASLVRHLRVDRESPNAIHYWLVTAVSQLISTPWSIGHKHGGKKEEHKKLRQFSKILFGNFSKKTHTHKLRLSGSR